MAVLNTATVPVSGDGTIDIKIVTKLEAALVSLGRVYAYCVVGSLSTSVGTNVVGAGQNQVPNLDRLHGWVMVALWSGVPAVLAFLLNILSPRATVAK